MIAKKPMDGVKYEPGGETNPLEWKIHVTAPATYTVKGASRPSPFAGRVFTVTVRFPNNYPFKNPDLYFPPGVLYHPGVVTDTGVACTEPLEKAWGPVKNVTDVAKYILSVLSDPAGSSPVNEEAGKELDSDITKFEANARKYAEKAPKAT